MLMSKKRYKLLAGLIGCVLAYGQAAWAIGDVTQPSDTITASSPNNPGSEGVANAIDNQPTKYLNFDAAGNAIPTGFVVTPSVGATRVIGLAMESANDAPERDPATVVLQGSQAETAPAWDDAAAWTTIAEIAVPSWVDVFGPDDNRFKVQTFTFQNLEPFLHYRWEVTLVQDGAAANSMQIAEVELLGSVVPPDVTQPGDTITASSPNNPGSEGVANAIDNQDRKCVV